MKRRPERKIRRRTRRAKIKTEIDAWREKMHDYLLDLDKRLSGLEETVAELVKAK